MKIGKPKYEQSSKNYFTFKKDQNTFVLRILPPMGELADAGKWSIYHRVEFGYKTTDGKLKPFLSPRKVDYKTKMVEVESEAHVRREKIKAQQAQAEKEGNAQLEAQCKEMLRKYNQDAKHYMNVVDLQGNVGLFKIGHRGFQALQAEINRLRTEGIDPIALTNGRYFVFSRSGKGRDTLYTVKEYMQKQEMTGPAGQKVLADVPFPHDINDAIMSKLETDAFELNKVYPSVTPEEEYRIVHEGAVAVDEILGSKKNEASQGTTNTTSQEKVQQPVENVAQQTQENSEPVAKNETLEVNGETVNTQTGEIQEPKKEELAQTSTTPETSVASMSDDDFFAKMESGNF